MTSNTGHGHVFPRGDGVKARCGGPALCPACAIEMARNDKPDHRNSTPIRSIFVEGFEISPKNIIGAIADGDLSGEEAIEWIEKLVRLNAAPVAAVPEIEEAAEIISNLITSIEKGGLYSKEATLTFLGQAMQCLRLAAPEVKS